MAWIKNIFRYKLTVLFFVIGQLIIYVSIFGALNIYNKAYQKEQDRLKFQYKNRIEMSIAKMNKKDIISQCTNGVLVANAVLSGKLDFYFGEKKTSNRAEVILMQNEATTYELVSGRLPGSIKDDYGKNVVALGRYQYQYAYQENGKAYVTFDNEKYEVVGVIGNKESDFQDYKVVFDINCVGQNLKNTINEQTNYTINIGSNITKVNSSYEAIYNNIVNINKNTQIESKVLNSSGESTVTETLYKENFRVNVLVYVFCILNCMLMSEFWIIQRNKEIAIRRTYGFGKFRIIVGIIRDILMLCIVSLVIYIVIHTFCCLLKVNIYSIKWDITTIVTIIVINIISILSTIIYPAFKIMKMSPAIALKDME